MNQSTTIQNTDPRKYSKIGLPLEVKYCKKCVESNQRMVGMPPHTENKDTIKDTVIFDHDGVCLSCKYFERKKTIDWEEREKQLIDLLDKFRRNDGYYDVLVPGSGGKDSRWMTHLLKYKYNMNPLTITWAPHIYTEIGWENFQSWIHQGFDNILFTPNGKVHSTLTRLAFENMCHPFQPFIFGQYNLAPKIAVEKNIKLIMYGDYYPERGVGSYITHQNKEMDSRMHSREEKEEVFISGVNIEDLPKYGIKKEDLNPYLPLKKEIYHDANFETHYLPYYLNYDPQKVYYNAVEHTGFEINPDGRTEGTYTKYQSLDDKVDGFHYFTYFIKTGRGRATEDAAIEIRNGHLTREEGVALVQRFDGEFPVKYFRDFLEYTGLSEERFWEVIDQFRSPHIWKKVNGEWKLRQQVS